MNTLPKYVVTNTLTEGSWNPTTVLRGDAAESVSALKQQPGGELQIHGSSLLASFLLATGLIDTLRLAIAPTIIGEGRQLLPLNGASVGLRLVEHKVTLSGVLLLEYQTTGSAPLAEYAGVAGLA